MSLGYAKQSTISLNDCQTREQRLEILYSVEKQYKEYNAVIPNSTPDEIKWIKKEEEEIQSANTQRRYDLIRSNAYLKIQAKKVISEALVLIVKIKESSNSNQEIAYWTELAELILDKDFAENILKLNFGINPLDAYLFVYEGHKILSLITIPFVLKCKASNPDYYPKD